MDQKESNEGPKGISDNSNRLIVADSLNDRIQGFESIADATGGSGDHQLHPSVGERHSLGRWYPVLSILHVAPVALRGQTR